MGLAGVASIKDAGPVSFGAAGGRGAGPLNPAPAKPLTAFLNSLKYHQ
jgi:hypothetical protein